MDRPITPVPIQPTRVVDGLTVSSAEAAIERRRRRERVVTWGTSGSGKCLTILSIIDPHFM